MERGRPKSLRLYRLDKKPTVVQSPGPGPIRLNEWKPILMSTLADRNVVLHTDGARAYRMGDAQPNGVVHDWVVHKKERVLTEDGIVMYKSPRYVRIV